MTVTFTDGEKLVIKDVVEVGILDEVLMVGEGSGDEIRARSGFPVGRVHMWRAELVKPEEINPQV